MLLSDWLVTGFQRVWGLALHESCLDCSHLCFNVFVARASGVHPLTSSDENAVTPSKNGQSYAFNAICLQRPPSSHGEANSHEPARNGVQFRSLA